jgi:hypothetical protein
MLYVLFFFLYFYSHNFNDLCSNLPPFNTSLLSVFVTEDGGYGIVSNILSNVITHVTLLQKDKKTHKRDFQILWYNAEVVTRICVCNVAYQSSGYSCIFQTKNGDQVSYYEVDFLGDENYKNTTKFTKINLNDPTMNVIIDFLPLNYGGYVVKVTGIISGKVFFKCIDNEGNERGSASFEEYVYTSFVTSNNTIIYIPIESSIFDESIRTKLSVISIDTYTNFSTGKFFR